MQKFIADRIHCRCPEILSGRSVLVLILMVTFVMRRCLGGKLLGSL